MLSHRVSETITDFAVDAFESKTLASALVCYLKKNKYSACKQAVFTRVDSGRREFFLAPSEGETDSRLL